MDNPASHLSAAASADWGASQPSPRLTSILKRPSTELVIESLRMEQPSLASMSAWLRLMEKRERGPSPGFSSAHALLAFITIGAAGTIGRQALAERTGLGEGSVRTVLKKFRQGRYVVSDALGCHLTGSGKVLYESISQELTKLLPLQSSMFAVGNYQVAILVRSGADAVGSGIDQRDSAVRVGAKGATTYVVRLGKFAVPGGSSDCEKDFPGELWSTLRDSLRPENGDAVILCGAQDETTAKLGALSAALTLL
jgi:hypothetical protein